MDNIIIIGASGHAKVIVDIIQEEGKYHIIGLLDQNIPVNERVLGYQVLGKEEDLPNLIKKHALKGIFLAIGDNFIRSKAATRIRETYPELPFIRAIHPNTSIAKDVSIGEGTVIMAGVSINPSTSIGSFCILNTNASLDHDSSMGDFSSLAPGVITGGDCEIGAYSAIGIGAIILHKIHIGEHTVIGAASLVNKPTESFVVAYGIPARVIRNRKAGDKYL